MTSVVTLLRLVFLLAIFLISDSSFADEAVLVPSVPKGGAPLQIIRIVEQAFLDRKWTVEKTDESSVTASLNHSGYGCHMTVSLSGNVLFYKDSCTFDSTPLDPHKKPTHEVDVATPVSWVANLRSDITRATVALPDLASPQPPADKSSSVADRLKALEGLRDSGLISAQEFIQMRQDILKSL